MNAVENSSEATRPGRLRLLAARHPITVFLSVVLGLGWAILGFMALAHHGVVPGKEIPPPVFILIMQFLVLLPAALWVTWAADGMAAMKALLARTFRWRFGLGWWVFVLFGLPATTLAVGLLSGGSLKSVDLGPYMLKQLLSIGSAAVLINMWEETGWSGFLQTRLERRHSIVVAALLTAIPFAGIHLPLAFMGDNPMSVMIDLVLLVGAAPLVRLLFAVTMRGARDSILAVAILHALWNGSSGDDGLPGGLLTGVDIFSCALVAVVVLAVAAALANWGKLSRAYRAREFPWSPLGSANSAGS